MYIMHYTQISGSKNYKTSLNYCAVDDMTETN